MKPLLLHIGHHFYGAGNIGDDLMLAGFLEFLAGQEREVQLTCCTPFDPEPMRRRFPQVRWLPYEPSAREACVAACDAWIGLGDTPFQSVVGDWLLDHLVTEADTCVRHGKPMYFLAVGVNERAALDRPQTRKILSSARHVWARDAQSAEWLGETAGQGKVTAGADLAHLYLRGRPEEARDPQAVGYVLNFEDPGRFPRAAVEGFIAGRRDLRHRWLVQELRSMPGTERWLFEQLAPGTRELLELRAPDYAGAASAAEMLGCWGRPDTVVSSRYHAVIVAAWSGARVVAIDRNDKVRSLARDLGVSGHETFSEAGELAAAVAEARRVPRARLEEVASLAGASCAACIRAIGAEVAAAGATRQTLEHEPGFGLQTLMIDNSVALASRAQLEWPMFRQYMETVNAFAAPRGLRTFTNWSKVWEYPWLWFAALGRVDWAGKHLVDLGTELSPVPWTIARFGARVTLVETHGGLIPAWEKLRNDLNVRADYQVVGSERLPFPDASVDVVSSFSVIEHQPDKRLAVDEVVRILKPGGIFAVSFDICEPDRGMTFPEWNGRALTMREFEDLVWLHPAFGNTSRPTWNIADIPDFLAWHRQSAPHHNYVTAAAVLVKRG